jgi:hypothetical protein
MAIIYAIKQNRANDTHIIITSTFLNKIFVYNPKNKIIIIYKGVFMGKDKSNLSRYTKPNYLSLKAKFYALYLRYYIGVFFPITFFLILVWFLNENSSKA